MYNVLSLMGITSRFTRSLDFEAPNKGGYFQIYSFFSMFEFFDFFGHPRHAFDNNTWLIYEESEIGSFKHLG